MNGTRSAWVSSGLAVVCGVAGWVGLGVAELGANDSLDDVTAVLVTVEETLRGSTRTADATADALDAAAVSLETAVDTSAATGEVARDIADVSATLAPVVVAISDGLAQIDNSITDINTVLDAVPLALGSIGGIDATLTDAEALLDDLAAAESSLDQLASQTEELGPTAAILAADLRRVATELRSSSANIETLADDVGEAGSSLSSTDTGEPINLLLAQLVVAGLALAVVIGNWSDLRSRASEAP